MSGKPVVRIWQGATDEADAEEYVTYLERTGFEEYRSTPGNLGVLGLRRVSGGRAEFLLLSFWESMDAVRGFAGPDPERAVFYPEDDRFLIQRDEHVSHYAIVHNRGFGAAAGASDGVEEGA